MCVGPRFVASDLDCAIEVANEDGVSTPSHGELSPRDDVSDESGPDGTTINQSPLTLDNLIARTSPDRHHPYRRDHRLHRNL